MKIPVLEGPRVESRPIGTPYSSLNQDTGLGEVAQGLGQLNQGIGAADAAFRREKEKAEAFKVGEEDLRLGQAINTALHDKQSGFLLKQGENALDTDSAWKTLKKAQEEGLSRLTGEEQKQTFLLRSGSRLEQAREAMERHAGGQRVKLYGQVAEGQVQLALDDASNDYDRPEKVAAAVELAKGPLLLHLRDNLGLPPEKIQAELKKFEAQVHVARLDRYLEAGNWQGAQALFSEVKDVLGEQRGRVGEAIQDKKRNSEAEKLSQQVVELARGRNGRVDGDYAADMLESLIKDDSEMLAKARGLALQAAAREERAWDMETEKIGKSAYTAWNVAGWSGLLRSGLADELNKRNPDLYNGLRERTERKWREQQGDSAAKSEQARLNKLASAKFLNLSVAEQAETDPELFGARLGADDLGIAEIGIHKRKAAESVRGGGAQSETEFLRGLGASTSGMVKDEQDAETLKAEATIAYRKLVDANKGLPLDFKQAEGLIADLTEKRLRQRSLLGIDILRPDTQEYEFQRRARERKNGPQSSAAPEQLPGATQQSRPSKTARAIQLRQQGKSNANIARVLTEEGY